MTTSDVIHKLEYNDIYVFDWCVLEDVENNDIGLDATCLIDNGYCVDNISPHAIRDGVKYYTVSDLFSINADNDLYHMMLEQFVFQKLPPYIKNFNDTKSVQKIKKRIDLTRKYLLFRYKIVNIKPPMQQQQQQQQLEDDNNQVEFKNENKKEVEIEESLSQKLCKSLNQSVILYFDYLKNYQNDNSNNVADVIYLEINFNRFLKGVISALEALLDWK